MQPLPWHPPGLPSPAGDAAAGGDQAFQALALALARIIEPTSKLDSLRVLAEAGIDPPSYRTLTRHLPAYAQDSWRRWAGAQRAPRMRHWDRRRWCSTTCRRGTSGRDAQADPSVVQFVGEGQYLRD